MKKTILILTIIFSLTLNTFSKQTNLIEIETPGFIKTALNVFKQSPIFSIVDIKIASNGCKAIMLNGIIEDSEFKNFDVAKNRKQLNKEISFNINNKKYISVSQIIFFDKNNSFLKKITIPYNISVELINHFQEPLLIVTKSIHHGTYYEKIGYDIYNFKGNLIKSIKHNSVKSITPSIDSNYLCFKSYNVNGYASVFKIISVKDFIEKQKNKTGQKAKVKKYILKFHNLTPSFFLVLDNDENNPDVITVFGGTIEKLSLKTKEKVWKIDYIGGNVLDLRYNRKNETLNILLPHHQLTIVDAITGTILKSFNPKTIPVINNFYTNFKIDLASIKIDDKNLQFKMVAPDNTYLKCAISNKDFKNIRIKKYKFNYRQKGKYLVKHTGNDYFLLSITDSKIILHLLTKKDLFKEIQVTD